VEVIITTIMRYQSAQTINLEALMKTFSARKNLRLSKDLILRKKLIKIEFFIRNPLILNL
jgi:hypothetical protein